LPSWKYLISKTEKSGSKHLMTKNQIMRKLHERKELLQGETTCKRLQYHKKKTT